MGRTDRRGLFVKDIAVAIINTQTQANQGATVAESGKASNDECEKVECETALARQDAKSLALVPEGSERHLAAAVVGENARNHAAYRAMLQLQSPEVAREVHAATIVNGRRISGEDDRETAEFVVMQLGQGRA